jgi:hypothetical protein
MAVLWAVVPCSLVEVYLPFTGACCFHLQVEFSVLLKYITVHVSVTVIINIAS